MLTARLVAVHSGRAYRQVPASWAAPARGCRKAAAGLPVCPEPWKACRLEQVCGWLARQRSKLVVGEEQEPPQQTAEPLAVRSCWPQRPQSDKKPSSPLHSFDLPGRKMRVPAFAPQRRVGLHQSKPLRVFVMECHLQRVPSAHRIVASRRAVQYDIEVVVAPSLTELPEDVEHLSQVPI